MVEELVTGTPGDISTTVAPLPSASGSAYSVKLYGMLAPRSQCLLPVPSTSPPSPSKTPSANEVAPAGTANCTSRRSSLSVTKPVPDAMTRNRPSVELQLGKHLNWPSADCAAKVHPSSRTAARTNFLTSLYPGRIIGKPSKRFTDLAMISPERQESVRSWRGTSRQGAAEGSGGGRGGPAPRGAGPSAYGMTRLSRGAERRAGRCCSCRAACARARPGPTRSSSRRRCCPADGLPSRHPPTRRSGRCRMDRCLRSG